jgi:hypothetical protein
MLSATHPSFSLRELHELLEPAARTADVAAAFRHVMTSPVLLDLGDLSPRLVRQLETLPCRNDLLIRSVRDLLHDPSPRPELLRVLKTFAKENSTNPDSPLPRDAATVLYYLCIAAALLRHRQRITKMDDAGLRKGLSWSLDRPWVDEETRGLLRQALQAVGSGEAG